MFSCVFRAFRVMGGLDAKWTTLAEAGTFRSLSLASRLTCEQGKCLGRIRPPKNLPLSTRKPPFRFHFYHFPTNFHPHFSIKTSAQNENTPNPADLSKNHTHHIYIMHTCDKKMISGKKIRPYGRKILYTTSFAKQFSLSLSLFCTKNKYNNNKLHV